MSLRTFTINLADEAATSLLGNDLSRALIAGDCVTLSGELGAGKTTLCRALIRSLAGDFDLDVPSPTFTYVQSYDLKLPVAHFDLYRLNDPDELEELGLDEALQDGVALIEWPQRASALLPKDGISISLSHETSGRIAVIACDDIATPRIERSLALRGFLQRCGRGPAVRQPFVGDASARVYELIYDGTNAPLVCMDQRPSPAGPPVWKGMAYRDVAHTTNPTVHPFVAICAALQEKGFATPHILHRDLEQNFLILEHLGHGSLLDAEAKPLEERYILASQLLAKIHEAGIGQHIHSAGLDWNLPPFDRDALLIEVSLALDWYLPYRLNRKATETERIAFFAAWNDLFETLNPAKYGIMLRDYHSPNLIWRGEKSSFDKVGVLDFQDALWGPNAYDLASLSQDARVTIGQEMEANIVNAYIKAHSHTDEFDEDQLRHEYAVMALQRNTKILGIFIRLHQRDGKQQYLTHLPRIENYVRRTLKASGFSRLQSFYADIGL